jgi:hypothetical protein
MLSPQRLWTISLAKFGAYDTFLWYAYKFDYHPKFAKILGLSAAASFSAGHAWGTYKNSTLPLK